MPEVAPVIPTRRDGRWAAAALLLVAVAAAVPAYADALREEAQRAYSAAMQGCKAETLAAVQREAAAGMPAGDDGWSETPQYAALVRFGLWDEMLAVLPPDPRRLGLTAGYLYARGVALAARGQLAAARAILSRLQALAPRVPADAQAGANTLRTVLAVAVPIVAARIAASEYRSDAAVARLREAVVAEDRLVADEPADWFFPARHLLGAQLLEAGRAAQAEQVYREDLRRHPGNGWSLYGLAAALRGQGRSGAAQAAERQFEAAWRHADVRLVASAFWFAGPDTTSCECQREDAAAKTAGR